MTTTLRKILRNSPDYKKRTGAKGTRNRRTLGDVHNDSMAHYSYNHATKGVRTRRMLINGPEFEASLHWMTQWYRSFARARGILV